MMARALLTLAAASVLAACAGPQIHHSQLSVLDKGLPPGRVTTLLELEPLSRHTVKGGQRTFEFHRFRMNNGLQTDPYFLAYEQDRLLYWGYVSEFRRLPDRDLNDGLSSALHQIRTTGQ